MKKDLVFLPGWIFKYLINKKENIQDFYQELLEELRKNFNVYFITFPGFSNVPEPDEIWTLDNYVEYLRKKITELNLKTFYLMGHSFGGQVALKYTYLYPDQIEKLILYAPACIRRKNIKNKIFNWFKKPGQFLFKFSPLLRKIFYKIFIGSTFYLQLSPIMQKTMQNIINEDLSHILDKIKVKTIIIWGEKDKITPLEHGKLMKKLMENAELIIKENGDHNFHKLDPQFIVKVII